MDRARRRTTRRSSSRRPTCSYRPEGDRLGEGRSRPKSSCWRVRGQPPAITAATGGSGASGSVPPVKCSDCSFRVVTYHSYSSLPRDACFRDVATPVRAPTVLVEVLAKHELRAAVDDKVRLVIDVGAPFARARR